MRNGPSPYAVKVIAALLRGPLTWPEIERRTRLSWRTVLAQVHALRAAGAIRTIGRASYFAIYQLELEEVAP